MRLGIISRWIAPYKTGGIEKYSLELTKGLAKRGVNCWNITYYSDSSTVETDLKILQVKSRSNVGGWFNLGFLGFFSTTYKACKRIQFDTIIIQNAGIEELLSSLAACILKIPVIVTIHGLLFTLSPLRPGSLIARLVVKNARKIIVVSPYTYDFLFSRCRFLGISKGKVVTIPTAVDMRKFNPDLDGSGIRRRHHLEDSFVVFSVSRLAKVKGIEYLIHAVKLALNEIKNLKLLVVGSGPEEEKLRLISKKIGISNKVLFVGRVSDDDLPRYYSACDIFVVPSVHEGVPATILEAFASEKPVISTCVGAIPYDLIQNRKNGLLVNPRDAVSLSKAIINLFNDERKRRELGVSGRKNIESGHNWDKVINCYLELCRELITGGIGGC